MEQLYTLLKNSINEEMGWMIDHIYEDYKDTEDILGFALSCEKILRLYYGADIHEQIRDLLIYVFYVYLDYDEDIRWSLVLSLSVLSTVLILPKRSVVLLWQCRKDI